MNMGYSSGSRHATALKIAGLCGVLGPVVAFVFTSLAIFYFPCFTWTENWLSDLGAQGTAATLFNSGLIAGGILAIGFGIGLREIFLNKPLGHLGALLFILDACALCAIGIFPETVGVLHTIVSVVFFALIPLSLLLIGVAVVNSSKKNWGTFLFILSTIAVVVWAIPCPWGRSAIQETIALLSLLTWVMPYGLGIASGKFHTLQK
jgi:hypothetical membrane protein